MSRSCGTCTKCCEGFLHGNVNNKPFFKGRPCHFVSIGKGCTTYETRPVSPCIEFTCAWLTDPEIPEWMKPDAINAIIEERTVEGIPYTRVTEAGSSLDNKVLNWVIYNKILPGANIFWSVDGGENFVGSQEFLLAMKAIPLPETNTPK